MSRFKRPSTSALAEPFWEGARRGTLVLQRCADCRRVVHYPSVVCDRCLSRALEWEEMSGRGTVVSFTTVHRAFSEEFEPDVPYTVALVRLEEGSNLLTWLTEVAPEDVAIGMEVMVTFERVSNEISLHRFRAAS